MTKHNFLSLTAAAVAVAFAIAPPAAAQADADDDNERPNRGVARVSLINGDVTVKRGDSGDWTAAAINAPLVVEDRLLTGAASRAEVQFDYSNMIRVAANSEIRMAELQPERYIVQVARGLVTFSVLRDQHVDIEVSTPSIAVRPAKRGQYRIEVRDDGTTEVSVRSGEAEIFTPQGTERLRSGRTLVARGTTANPEFRDVADTPIDDWDRWNQRRDRDLDRSESRRYVSQDIYGVEDLDAHGRWVNVPQYGYVWSPVVAAGWAPYRAGRWAWVDWYGWTWVSYDPWGWAPYHYGRWFNQPGIGWCWWPGAVRSRHWWRPALVGFFGWDSWNGFRAGIGVGFGFGRIGWCPLAPYERYRPWYGNRYYGGYRNNTYIDNSVRIVNNVNVTNIYRNARFNGVSGADHGDFVGGRGHRNRAFGEADLQRAASIEGRVPMVPERASLRMADREVTPRGGGATNERFFSRRQPATVERASFDEQRRGMEQVARRAFGNGSGEATRGASVDNRGAEQPARGPAEGSRSAAGVVGGGDRRGERGSSAANEGSRGADNGGWRTFGNGGDRRSSGDRGSSAAGSTVTEGSRSSDNGGGRTFGNGGDRRSSGDRGSSAGSNAQSGGVTEGSRGADNGGWRTFGNGGDRRSSGSDTNRSVDRGSDNGGWRRSGGGADAGSSGRSADGAGNTNNSSGGWRRFGEPGSSGGAATDGSSRGSVSEGRGGSDAGSARSSDGWRRFGDPSSSRSAPADSGRGWGRSERSNDSGNSGGGAWRQPESTPNTYGGGSNSDSGWGNRRSERSGDVQVSPRIVRERDSGSSSSRSADGWSGGGGGGRRSEGWSGGGDRGSGGGGASAPTWSGGGGRSSGGDPGNGRSMGGWSGGGGGGGGRSGGDSGGGGRSMGGWSGGGGGGGGRSGGDSGGGGRSSDGGGGGRGGDGGGRRR